jgi:hypothetical protein
MDMNMHVQAGRVVNIEANHVIDCEAVAFIAKKTPVINAIVLFLVKRRTRIYKTMLFKA